MFGRAFLSIIVVKSIVIFYLQDVLQLAKPHELLSLFNHTLPVIYQNFI